MNIMKKIITVGILFTFLISPTIALGQTYTVPKYDLKTDVSTQGGDIIVREIPLGNNDSEVRDDNYRIPNADRTPIDIPTYSTTSPSISEVRYNRLEKFKVDDQKQRERFQMEKEDAQIRLDKYKKDFQEKVREERKNRIDSDNVNTYGWREKFQKDREDAQIRLDEYKKNFQEKKKELKEKREIRKKDRKEHFSEVRKERINAFSDRMVRRIDAAFGRFDTIIKRIKSRIVKLESINKNINTDDADNYLAQADIHIIEGLSSLEKAKTAIQNLIGSGDTDNPQELFKEVKNLIRQSVDKLKIVKEDIKNAIRSIKAQVTPDNEGDLDSDSNTSTSTETDI